MFPLKTVIIGVVLILLGAAGFVYNATRPKPLLVSLQPEALPIAEAQPTPEPTPDDARVTALETTKPKETPGGRATPPPRTQTHVRPLSVKLVSPVMAETFTAPATVTLKAIAHPAGEDLRKIEFYRDEGWISVCRSLSNSDVPNSLKKIAEVTTAPYEFIWSNLDRGTYNIMAVATYATGVRQFSPPVVIVVNAADTYDGSEWRGWRPPYLLEEMAEQDAALMPSPPPKPKRRRAMNRLR